MKYTCPICGHKVFDQKPGSYEICPICYWEDDLVQLLSPTFWGGANSPSLVDAQRNYRRFGAIEERFIGRVRPPADELKDLDWRPFDEGRDLLERDKSVKFKYPDDPRELYYWNNYTP